jgi:predicted ATPase
MEKELNKGLYLTSVEFLEDYICFDKGETFTFKPGLNLLVGDQSAGKSTLLQILTKQINPKVDIKTTGPVSFFFFDTEKDNPRVVQSIEHSKDPLTILQSKFQSHGEALLPFILGLKEAKDTIIFIDEPEAGLSIRSQLKVVEAIKKAVSNGAQIVLSTHSYFIIQMDEEVLSLEHRKWMTSNDFIETQKQDVIKKEKKKKSKKVSKEYKEREAESSKDMNSIIDEFMDLF